MEYVYKTTSDFDFYSERLCVAISQIICIYKKRIANHQRQN